MKTKFFSAVLSAFMLATASIGVTAYAEETAASSAADIVETTTANSTTTANETDTPTETTTAEKIPDFYGDSYYDTDGNASLIKSEKIIYNTEEMQFFAVTTKDGHVFYVLINYSAENGEDQVFFLNKVDDYDLYALLYAGEENNESGGITPEGAAQAAEDVNGRVKPKTDSGSENTAETTESGEDTSEGDEKQAESAPMNKNSIYLVFGAIALIGVGAAGFMLTKKKNGSKKSVVSEPEYDEETEIVENEDEDDMAFYDHNDDEE